MPAWSRLPVREQIARECVNIAYGFFSPLEGFMGRADVDSVAREDDAGQRLCVEHTHRI